MTYIMVILEVCFISLWVLLLKHHPHSQGRSSGAELVLHIDYIDACTEKRVVHTTDVISGRQITYNKKKIVSELSQWVGKVIDVEIYNNKCKVYGEMPDYLVKTYPYSRGIINIKEIVQ